VAEDLPPDVRAVLTQLFAEGRNALAADERDAAVETVTSAEAVATNKLPEGSLRDRLLHGCERVRRLLDADPGGDADPTDRDDLPDVTDRDGSTDPADRDDSTAHTDRDDLTERTNPGDGADAAAAYLAAMERRVANADDRS
jgi:hypothetical protein